MFASKARKKVLESHSLTVTAADTKVEVPSTVVFRGSGTGLVSNWQEALPNDEEAMAVAVGGDWAAVATSSRVSTSWPLTALRPFAWSRGLVVLSVVVGTVPAGVSKRRLAGLHPVCAGRSGDDGW